MVPTLGHCTYCYDRIYLGGHFFKQVGYFFLPTFYLVIILDIEKLQEYKDSSLYPSNVNIYHTCFTHIDRDTWTHTHTHTHTHTYNFVLNILRVHAPGMTNSSQFCLDFTFTLLILLLFLLNVLHLGVPSGQASWDSWSSLLQCRCSVNTSSCM